MKNSHKMMLAAAALFSASVNAAPITLSSVAGDWSNIAPAGVATFYDTDGLAGNEEIRWGDPATTNGQSGYRFDGAAPPATTVNVGDQFVLGSFTHFNFPIYAPSLTGAQLNINADLSVGGTAVSQGPFTFAFTHDETPNQYQGCCNDIVTFNNLVSSDTFFVGGTEYTLTLEGFRQGGVFTTGFSTVENQANTAELIASFTAVPPTEVAEPGTLALLGLGLVGLGAARRGK